MAYSSVQKHPRYSVAEPLNVTVEELPGSISLENISVGGAFLRTGESRNPGQILSLTLSTHVGNVQATARVMHVQHGGRRGPGVGVQFETMSAASRDVLQRYVESLALARVRAAVKVLARVQEELDRVMAARSETTAMVVEPPSRRDASGAWDELFPVELASGEPVLAR